MPSSLAIHGGDPVIDSNDARFIWPIITDESREAIIDQLYTSISIYDKSGVIDTFENQFAHYHSRQYALLSNSGTSAIFSMFEAINLQPGDEVLCPVYTFHASVSPLTYTGASPVFCDSDEQGNISIEEIRKHYSKSTKAVVVTHMWGVPAKDIVEIKKFCDEHNLWLLEDCSHAHGASIYGKKVGSFGHMASWSLQGQKIITGGEGGIMLTDDRSLYERALLQGHYNKRPKQEIDQASPMRKYFLTGMGLKLRSHPLAVALALQQFQHLDDFTRQKQVYAQWLHDSFKEYPFLEVPPLQSDVQNSWYAFNIKYDASKAYEVSRERFVEALIAEGLIEADIPGSTGLIHELPLFTTPNEIMARLYTKPLPPQGPFPVAEIFYNSIIKLPVWTREEDRGTVQAYIDGIRKVANFIVKEHNL